MQLLSRAAGAVLLFVHVCGTASPFFSIPGGVYTNSSVSVTILPTTPGAAIVYSFNGPEPGTNSAVYRQSLTLSNSTLVRAREMLPDRTLGPTVSQNYVFAGGDLAEFTSNLPILVINTYGRGIPDNNLLLPVSIRVMNNRAERVALNSPADYDGRAGMAVRGQSSSQFPKKPYKLELWDQGTNDFQAGLLGMPAESDWVLYAPYSDKTLMRNFISYRLYEDMGHYSVRTRFVEVFVDVFGGRLTMSDYAGVYVLVEKIKRDGSRVDIQKLEPTHNSMPEISGGYIVKKDKLDPGEITFRTSRGIQLSYVEPNQDEITVQQKQWLSAWFNEFEAALYGSEFKNPTNGYAKYIELVPKPCAFK